MINDRLFQKLRISIERWVGDLDEERFREITSRFKWLELEGGAQLIRQGDPGDAVYLLAGGRLQVVRDKNNGQSEIIGEIAPGEMVGEMAMITGENRSANIIALRDCVLARMEKKDFDDLAFRYPKMVMHIAKSLVERFRIAAKADRLPKKIINICVLPVTEGVDEIQFTRTLCDALTSMGTVLFINSRRVDDLLNQPGIAQCSRDETESYQRLSAWLEEKELDHRFVVYLADGEDNGWTRRCLRQADEILLVARSERPPALHPLESRYLSGAEKLTPARQRLVLLHQEDRSHYAGTAQWLDPRPIAAHHHVQSGNKRDMARLARFLSGNATGLVLSGGAAKGFAHIGVYRALEEAGIDIDMVGGTSIGAIMGALIARGWDGQTIRSECKRVFEKNPTGDFNLIPRVSLFKGKILDKMLKENFGGIEIEDSRLNFFCVSCNITRTQPHVHFRGDFAGALRASGSIPGVFPPAVLHRDLHVDGGVINNMPIDLMRQLGAGFLIAVDLQVYKNKEEGPDEANQELPMPNLINIVMESSMLSGRYLAQEHKKIVDLYFNPPLRGINLIDWAKFDKIERIGYLHALEVLDEAGGEGGVTESR